MIVKGSKERLWHHRYGHRGEQSLQKLAGKRFVNSFDYDISKDIGFCEACISGNHHRSRICSGIITCHMEYQ